MTTRRTPSTTSLSKYVRANSPDFGNRSLDFCNAFWGMGDGGVDVLFARMRGAARTMEELRTFWKERAAIEDDYAKRLAKLAKLTLGKDEIGELRNSLDTIRLETDKQAGYHQTLAQQIRNDLENQTSAFLARQSLFKKTAQAAVEKEFKTKNTQESYVNKAKEKYEADCVRINSYTAQSTLMQGKDLDRIQVKLERAQQTVQANEKDFANFAKALQDTVQKWEQTWKLFCDSCQDLEEERMEFMKDNMWAYANAVSTVCVADDESCEKLRVALEQFEPDKDMENFVRDYGTGNQLPDPPTFVNYANPDAVRASSSRVTSRPSTFSRQSDRAAQRQSSFAPVEDTMPATNIAGIGSKASEPGFNQALSEGRGNANGANRVNGAANGASGPHGAQKSTGGGGSGGGGSIAPTTELVIGDQAYQVDPTKDPQTTRPGQPGMESNVGRDDDPLAKQMKELRSGAGSVRRASMLQHSDRDSNGHTKSNSLSAPPESASSSKMNYRLSAEAVVGSYPTNVPSSRPVSPSQPTAVMMKPPQSSSPSSSLPVEGVVADYHQKLPGERSHSRSGSRQSERSQIQGSQNKSLDKPVNREVFAGIGSQGRSPSPSFDGSRSTSPAPPRRGSLSIARVQAPSMNGDLGRSSTTTASGGSGPNRATTPNSVGIALDPSGKVAVDEMAAMYTQQPQSQPPQQYHPPPAQMQPTSFQRRVSVGGGNTAGTQVMHVPQHQPSYGGPPPVLYGNQSYMHPPQQPPPITYANVPPAHYVPPPHEYQNSVVHPYAAQSVQSGLNRGQSLSGGYYPLNGYGRPASPQQAHNQAVTSPASSMPTAPPTGQYTETGAPVLFYVKALYDYTASIEEEEFDFQAGDIIAVTSTPEDGWWTGELLDEARRQPGRNVFPSNFVCLF